MNIDDEYISMYYDKEEDERMIREGIIKEERAWAREEGLKEGREDTIKEMVNNLHKNGVSLDLIAKSANLSLDEVKKIISFNNK